MADIEKFIQKIEKAKDKSKEYGLDEIRMTIEFADVLVELLKEQDAVVHCKDCKYWSAERINDYNKCRRGIKVGVKNFATTGEWFCADGRKKDA